MMQQNESLLITQQNDSRHGRVGGCTIGGRAGGCAFQSFCLDANNETLGAQSPKKGKENWKKGTISWVEMVMGFPN